MKCTRLVSKVRRAAIRETHSEVDVLQDLVVEVCAGVRRTDGDGQAQVRNLVLHVGDVRVEERRARIADRRVGVVSAAVCADVAKNHDP